MVKIKDKKHGFLHRMKIIRGQIDKIIDMIEKDQYCIDILHNSLSVQKALKNVDMVIMEEHLSSCAIDQAKKGETEKLVKELISIYKFK